MGLSQEHLAQSVGVSFQQMQKYESGLNRITCARLVDIARALDCNIASLVYDLEPADPLDMHAAQILEQLKSPSARNLLAAFTRMPVNLQLAILDLLAEIGRTRNLPGL